jgi:uncharacterized protein (UPF0264 family)
MAELELNPDGPDAIEVMRAVSKAIFATAQNQTQITWLTEDGKRIAAIVPLDVAGFAGRCPGGRLRYLGFHKDGSRCRHRG